MQPANYFQSLSQPAGMSVPAIGPMTNSVNAGTPAVVTNANQAVSVASTGVPVDSVSATAASSHVEDNGPFVLPDPPSDHQHERDQASRFI